MKHSPLLRNIPRPEIYSNQTPRRRGKESKVLKRFQKNMTCHKSDVEHPCLVVELHSFLVALYLQIYSTLPGQYYG